MTDAEPSCYKVEMERERALKLKFWMEITPEKITAHLPMDDQASGTQKPSDIQRSASATHVVASTYAGYEIKKTRSKYIIQDIVSPVSSAGTLAPKSLFQQEVEDAELSLEELMPQTEARSSGLSRSCINIHHFLVDQFYPPTRLINSCHNLFLPDVEPPKTVNFEGLQIYNNARVAFYKYMKSLQLAEDIEEVELHFSSLYPNYWRHLLKKCHVHMDPDIASDEQEAWRDIAGTCTGTLEEEMEIEGRDSIRDIGLTGSDVIGDFKTSVIYLKVKYPYLFAYLIIKHEFGRFTKERLTVDKNRVEFKALLGLNPEKLAAREEKYREKHSAHLQSLMDLF